MAIAERENYIIPSIIAIVISMAIFMIVPQLLFPDIHDTYKQALVQQLTFAVPVFLSVIILKKAWIYRPNLKMLKAGWKTASVWIFIILLNVFRSFAAEIEIDAFSFLLFALQVFFIGYCEEVLYRGLLLNAFHKKFGIHSLAGTRLAVVLSGIIFGATHLLNARNPELSFASAATQAGTAVFLGLFIGAIYIRCGKALWFVIILHALNDGAAYVASGRMGGVSAAEIIEQIGQQAGYIQVVVLGIVFGGLTIILLRKKKLQPCLSNFKYE